MCSCTHGRECSQTPCHRMDELLSTAISFIVLSNCHGSPQRKTGLLYDIVASGCRVLHCDTRSVPSMQSLCRYRERPFCSWSLWGRPSCFQMDLLISSLQIQFAVHKRGTTVYRIHAIHAQSLLMATTICIFLIFWVFFLNYIIGIWHISWEIVPK